MASPRIVLSLQVISVLIIDRHLVFCLLIVSDKEGEEDPKVISAGSFEDLRSYFDQKSSHLKRELLTINSNRLQPSGEKT